MPPPSFACSRRADAENSTNMLAWRTDAADAPVSHGRPRGNLADLTGLGPESIFLARENVLHGGDASTKSNRPAEIWVKMCRFSVDFVRSCRLHLSMSYSVTSTLISLVFPSLTKCSRMSPDLFKPEKRYKPRSRLSGPAPPRSSPGVLAVPSLTAPLASAPVSAAGGGPPAAHPGTQ